MKPEKDDREINPNGGEQSLRVDMSAIRRSASLSQPLLNETIIYQAYFSHRLVPKTMRLSTFVVNLAPLSHVSLKSIIFQL